MMRLCNSISAVLLYLFLMSLAGCSKGHPHTIAVVPQTTAQEVWEGEHAGIARALLGTHWSERWNGPSSEMEVDRQIGLVEQAIHDRDGGLVLAPDHPVALSTVIRRAVQQGMQVVVIDAELQLPPSMQVTYLLNDEEATGLFAAKRVGALLHGHGTVAVFGSTTSLMATMARSAAFHRQMAALYPGITVLDPLPGAFRTNLAEQDTEDLMASHPEVTAIVTLSVGATRGVYRGLKLTQKIPQVHLVACDQDLDLLYYLRLGEVDSVVAENTFAMGYRAAQLIMHPDGRNRVIRFAPYLVTRENVDTPEIQNVLTMDWRPQP